MKVLEISIKGFSNKRAFENDLTKNDKPVSFIIDGNDSDIIDKAVVNIVSILSFMDHKIKDGDIKLFYDEIAEKRKLYLSTEDFKYMKKAWKKYKKFLQEKYPTEEGKSGNSLVLITKK